MTKETDIKTSQGFAEASAPKTASANDIVRLTDLQNGDNIQTAFLFFNNVGENWKAKRLQVFDCLGIEDFRVVESLAETLTTMDIDQKELWAAARLLHSNPDREDISELYVDEDQALRIEITLESMKESIEKGLLVALENKSMPHSSTQQTATYSGTFEDLRV